VPLGIGGKKSFSYPRAERRIPMEVGVQISGHSELPGTEMTFTQNVSSRGARVMTSRKWNLNDRLTIATLTGAFQSLARVAYCEAVHGAGFVVGLEFVQPEGRWVVGEAF
jgi:hypothetical protein